MIIFCPKDGGSWSVDLSGGGGLTVSFCPGVEGSEKNALSHCPHFGTPGKMG